MKIVANKDVEAAISEAHLAIDAAAETARRLETSGGEGMQAVYAHKHAEAVRYISGEQPSYSYPLLSAEAAALNMEVREVAKRVVWRVEDWKSKMGAIEAHRLALKAKVSQLNCVATIRKISQSARFD
jgi:hypothetical protein